MRNEMFSWQLLARSRHSEARRMMILILILLWSICAGEVVAQTADKEMVAEPRDAWTSYGNENVELMLKPLKVISDFEFFETSLQAVIAKLNETHGLNLVLDGDALELAGIDPDEPVTLSATKISVAAALSHLLRQLDLTIMPFESQLLVTTINESEQHPFVRFYPVGDLLAGSAHDVEEPDSLVDLVTRVIAPNRGKMSAVPERSGCTKAF